MSNKSRGGRPDRNGRGGPAPSPAHAPAREEQGPGEPEVVELPFHMAKALRAYFGGQKYDDVAGACSWLDTAIAAAIKQHQADADQDSDMDDLAHARQ